MIAQDPTIDYTDLGYNNRLQATDSLAANNDNFVTSTQFEAENDRNTVSNYNIKTISAEKINAGTITTQLFLGGTSIIIDGAAKQIIVNDGTTDRILIGYGSALF